jgi:hypothetical protein
MTSILPHSWHSCSHFVLLSEISGLVSGVQGRFIKDASQDGSILLLHESICWVLRQMWLQDSKHFPLLSILLQDEAISILLGHEFELLFWGVSRSGQLTMAIRRILGS